VLGAGEVTTHRARQIADQVSRRRGPRPRMIVGDDDRDVGTLGGLHNDGRRLALASVISNCRMVPIAAAI
jgi:hypothetical protein